MELYSKQVYDKNILLLCNCINKLNEMIKKNIDLVDMDRWNVIEDVLGKEISFDDALYIANKLWEENIEVLDLV